MDNIYRHPHLQNKKQPIIDSNISPIRLRIHFQWRERTKSPSKSMGALGMNYLDIISCCPAILDIVTGYANMNLKFSGQTDEYQRDVWFVR